jgi:pilus assembly protein Flp/PilA
MKNQTLKLWVRLQTLRSDIKGQDLIEYALMAGFVSVAAGAVMPQVATDLQLIYSKIQSVLYAASQQGNP